MTSSAESAQESLKQQVKAATAAYYASAEVLYQVLTDLTDMLAGAAGKKTALGKTVLTVRRQLNAARWHSDAEPPTPRPDPVATRTPVSARFTRIPGLAPLLLLLASPQAA